MERSNQEGPPSPITISGSKEFDCDADQSERGVRQYDRQRIIKGVKQRIDSNRVSLFDLLFINSGEIQDYLPSLCASYVFFDANALASFINIENPRRLAESDLTQALFSLQFFDESEYWANVKVFIENSLHGPPDTDILLPFSQEISDMASKYSVDELTATVETVRQLIDSDIEEHQIFYTQLYQKLKLFLATAFLDKYHNSILKKATKTLPDKLLVTVAPCEGMKFTKAQVKFRMKVLQQPHGSDILNKFARRFFDPRFHIEKESLTHKVLHQNEMEGFNYWGDEEFEFDDSIDMKLENVNGYELPAYEAKVYKGYDWNPHARATHDPGNLPEPVIRGYFFRIFYPNLENKREAPKFRLAPEIVGKNGPDEKYKYTAIVFDAGPPYLSLAFRIVDKEWDIYRTGGYTTQFYHGEFSLQIVFKASLYYQGYLPQQLY